jgi:hypothetical protein
VLRELKEIAIDVIRQHAEKSPIARKVYASFTQFQTRIGAWDHLGQGVYYLTSTR